MMSSMLVARLCCVASGHRAGRIDARGVLVNREGDVNQGGQRLRQVGIGDLVARLAALGFGSNDAAVAQARQMIGHVGACEVQIAGQLCRVGRPVEQRQDDPGPGRVGQRAAQPVHHVQARSNGQHALNYTARTEVVLRSPESLSVRTRLCQLGIDPRDDSPDHQGTHEAATEPRHITAKATPMLRRAVCDSKRRLIIL